MLQKVILFLSFLFIPFSHVSVDTMAVPASDSPTPVSELAAGEQLFEEMELGGIVNFIAFRQAVAGYNRIKEKSKKIPFLSGTASGGHSDGKGIFFIYGKNYLRYTNAGSPSSPRGTFTFPWISGRA